MSTGAGANALNVDFSSTDCFTTCQILMDTYIRAVAGGQRVRVSYDNYSVEYKQSDFNALRDLYTTMRANCPAALAALPNLEKGASVQRGPAIFGAMRPGQRLHRGRW